MSWYVKELRYYFVSEIYISFRLCLSLPTVHISSLFLQKGWNKFIYFLVNIICVGFSYYHGHLYPSQNLASATYGRSLIDSALSIFLVQTNLSKILLDLVQPSSLESSGRSSVFNNLLYVFDKIILLYSRRSWLYNSLNKCY